MNEDDWPGTSQAFRKYTHIPTGDRRSLVRRDMAPLGRISEFPKGSVADKYMDIMYQKRVERKQQVIEGYQNIDFFRNHKHILFRELYVVNKQPVMHIKMQIRMIEYT